MSAIFRKIIIYLFIIFPSLILLSQPPLDWVRQIDGSQPKCRFISDIERDFNGNIYVAGHFSNDTVDFDPSPATFTMSGDYFCFKHGYIVKLSPSGNFIWAKEIVGSSPTGVTHFSCLKTDRSGNVYLGGSFENSIDFDPGPGTHILSSIMGNQFPFTDGFLLKLDPQGNFVWVKEFNSYQASHNTFDPRCTIVDMKFDSRQNICLTGVIISSADLDPGPSNALFTGTTHWCHSYAVKLDSTGQYLWGRMMTGNGNSWPNSITTDHLNNVIFGGRAYSGADLNTGPGALTTTSMCGYVSRLDSNGTFIGSSAFYGNNIQVHSVLASNGIWVAGVFSGTCDIDPGPGQSLLTTQGGYSGILLKLNGSGGLVSGGELKGMHLNDPKLAINGKGELYTSFGFGGIVDCDPGPQTHTLTSQNSPWAFMGDRAYVKYDSTGSFVWAFAIPQIGGSHNYSSFRIATNGDVFTAAVFHDTLDVDPTNASAQIIPLIGSSIFVSKLSVCQASNTPNINVVASNPTLCLGESTSLFAYGASSYKWNNNLPPGQMVSITPTASTIYEVVGTDSLGCTNTSNIYVTVLKCAGLADEENAPVQVYPNPTSGHISIEGMPVFSITVFDCTGRQVFQDMADDKNSLDLSCLEKGIYTLELVTEDRSTRILKLMRH